MSRSSRRDFISLVGGGVGAAALAPGLLQSQSIASQDWDFSWLDKLTGKHRQLFDLGNLEIGLIVVRNWYDAWERIFRLKHPDVNAVVGIAGSTFPINASDELYREFPIGERWQIKDPVTGEWAVRNIFMEGGEGPPMLREAKVRLLQARGAVFWQCNNALHGVAHQLASVTQRTQPEIYAALRKGLNPGVIVVPAHTMLVGLCQERGCTYEKV